MAAKEGIRKKPSKKDGEKRREEKLKGGESGSSVRIKPRRRKKEKALRHGKGF